MKKGCLFMLAVWAAASAVYGKLLISAAADSGEFKWWIPVLLGLSIALVVGQLWSIALAFKRSRAAAHPQESWSDGDFVAVSGPLQAIKQPIESPASGERVLISEFELKKIAAGRNNQSMAEVTGFLMAPCGVQTTRGVVRLVGFPLTVHFPEETYASTAEYRRMGSYIAKAELKEMPSNPLAAIKDLMNVLADEDGDVNVTFVRKESWLHPSRTADFGPDSDDNIDAEADEKTGVAAPDAEPAAAQPQDRAAYFTDILTEGSYAVHEHAIKPGTVVTAFGTYRGTARAIDVGSGLKNITHVLQPGTAAGAVRSGIVKGFLGLIFWGGVALAANYFVVPGAKAYIDSAVTSATGGTAAR